MAKRLEMIDVDKPRTSVSELTETTDWSKCVICQEHIEEKLECPANSSRRDSGAGYKSFSQNVTLFHEMKTLQVPLNLGRLDEGSGIDETLMHNKASWHKSCRCKFNTTKLKRAEKRKVEVTANYVSNQRYTRSKTDTGSGSSICFFCDETLSDDEHREASTLELDSKVRKCALFLEDQSLLAKLSTCDMIAIEAKYHPRCLTELYNRVRGKERKQKSDHRTDDMLNSIALAELVSYIEESRQDAELSPVFKLKDLVSLYTSRLNQLGADIDKRVNSTRLKERILINIPDLQAHTKGREVILVFESDIGHAINRACNQSCDNEAMIMSKAASIVRKELFEMRSSAKEFNGNFSHDCQGSSVPHSLLALVSMIHEGPSIKDQTRQVSSSSALSVSQIIAFNTVKYKRDKATSSTIRHSRTQETPLPIYLGLLLHAHTRKKELIDKLSHLGLSVSYDRVLRTKAKALSFFHAFTGCDTVSCFVGHGNLGAWEAWNSFPDVTQVFEELGNVPSQVSEQYLDTLERFVVILYDRTSTCTQVNSARKYLFTKKRRTMERIPPTKEALRQHVLRAAYQAGHVWGQTCVLQPHLPPPEEWGWMKSEDGSFTPFWTTLPQVSESSKELIRCGCLTGCTNRRCKCVRHELLCTELCGCGGECTRD